jgi:inosose dehydratase
VDQRTLDVVNGVSVGTAAVNWGFDPFYTWARTPSFNQMLDEMAAAGYAGTEISYNFPADPIAVRAALDARGLRAAATFHAVNLRHPSLHAAALAASVPVADRLRALGSDVLILADLPSPERIAVAGRVAANGRNGLSDEQWRSLADGLNLIGEMLAQRQMRAVFHPHVGTYVETRAEIDRLCALTDASLVALCPDTGHLAYAGVAAEDLFRDYAARIGYVHLKDVDPAKLARVRAEKIDFVRAVEFGLFVELGSGMVSFARIFDALRRAGYQGWVIVEQDAARDPFTAASQNREYLRKEFAL